MCDVPVCADVLKKGSKVNVRDVESTLDNVVFLYGYISEKDVFERDYQVRARVGAILTSLRVHAGQIHRCLTAQVAGLPFSSS